MSTQKLVSCVTFNASQAAQDAAIAALAAQIAALGGVTSTNVAAAIVAMTPAQKAAVCAALACEPTLAQITAKLLLVPGFGVAGNVLTSTGSGLQGVAPAAGIASVGTAGIATNAGTAAAPIVSVTAADVRTSVNAAPVGTVAVPGTTQLYGQDGQFHTIPAAAVGGVASVGTAGIATNTGSANNPVVSVTAADVRASVNAAPLGAPAVAGTTKVYSDDGQFHVLPATSAAGVTSVGTAGIATNTGTATAPVVSVTTADVRNAINTAPAGAVAIPGTTQLYGSDGQLHTIPASAAAGVQTLGVTGLIVNTGTTADPVLGVTTTSIVNTVQSVPLGAAAVPGSSSFFGPDGQFHTLPSYPAPSSGVTLNSCAGAPHANGAQVPSCAEMNDAIDTAIQSAFIHLSTASIDCALSSTTPVNGISIVTSQYSAPATAQRWDGSAWQSLATVSMAPSPTIPGAYSNTSSVSFAPQAKGLFRVIQNVNGRTIASEPMVYDCSAGGGSDPGGNAE